MTAVFVHLPKKEGSLKMKKILSLILVACMLLTVCSCAQTPENKPDYTVTAMTVGQHQITAAELNYFYIDAVNEFVNQNSYFISYLLSVSKPLSQQMENEKTGRSWAAYFLESAIDSVKNTYALYDIAKTENHKLTEEETGYITSLHENMEQYVKYYSYGSIDEYLKKVYGDGADEASYQRYYEILITASSYFSAYAEKLLDSYDEPALRTFETDKEHKYNSYSYAYHTLAVSEFPSAEDCEAAAKSLAVAENGSEAALNSAIAALEKSMNKDTGDKGPSTAVAQTDVLYDNVTAALKEWVSKADRKDGDITYIKWTSQAADEATGTTKEVLKGYYVVVFLGKNDNQFQMADVRHILAAFKGGTTDPTTGLKVYSDAEKEAAKKTAEKIYQQWLDGEKTEESFAALAKEHTDDGNGAQGGLYTKIFPGQMVKTFNDWCFDPNRQTGDHGIVVTDFGYHIMFYSGDSGITYRDYMIGMDKQAEDMEKWQDELFKTVTATTVDTSLVNMDYIISPAS
jgi:hypothetical protein